MAGGINRLSDREVRAFVNAAIPGKKLFDGGGLYLYITPAGTPTWRIKYYDTNGNEKTHSPGQYPGVSLAAARIERTNAKALKRQGIDPVVAKRLGKAKLAASHETTFEVAAGEWLTKMKHEWSAIHYTKSSRALERDIYTDLAKLPIAEITPLMVANALDKVSSRGAKETAVRIHQHVNAIFRFAKAKGYCTSNPADGVEETLLKPNGTKPRPAIVDLNELGVIMKAAKATNNTPAILRAHRLCAFTGARIQNITDAEWDEFDLDGETPMWTIPRTKLKIKNRTYNHRIPLHPTVVDELREWREVIGNKGFVFPSTTSKLGRITKEGVEKLYRESLQLRGKHSPHSWRSAIKTNGKERKWADNEVIVIALDHLHDDEVALAYDRGDRLSMRVSLFHTWQASLLEAERGIYQTPVDKLHLARK